MTQKNRITYVIISVLVIISLIHAWYRVKHPIRVPDDVYSGSQGERLETWNDMRRLRLTDENISKFVEATLQNLALSPPKGTAAISYASLTELQKMDVREALVGFFGVYRGDAPEPIYDYFTVSRGPTQLAPDIKEAIQDIARQSGVTLSLEKAFDAWVYYWNSREPKGMGWESLLEKSGECCFWETNAPLTPDQSIQMVLTDPALFGNTTSFGHVFTISSKMKESLQHGSTIRFCDVFFVAELNKEKDQDFCATGIRFWFDESTTKWIPNSLILVTPRIRNDINILF